MVTEDIEERKDEPSYDLDQIKDLARAQDVHYAGTQVDEDTAQIGFELKDVCACLCRLTRAHFKESIRYAGMASWNDVYLIADAGSGTVLYKLYVKFKRYGELQRLFICSFHEQGRKK